MLMLVPLLNGLALQVLPARAAGQQQLTIQLAGPASLGFEVAGKTIVEHPWSISQDNASGSDPTEDGVELEVSLPAGEEMLANADGMALHVGVFSFSYSSSEADIETWMLHSGWPSPENPLRMTSVLAAQYQGLAPEELLGASCFGNDMLDFCVRAFGCLVLTEVTAAAAAAAGGSLRLATKLPYASNYRVEVYTEAAPTCRGTQELKRQQLDLHVSEVRSLWSIPPAHDFREHFRVLAPNSAAFASFHLLHVTAASSWWAKSMKLHSTNAWCEMMVPALEKAAQVSSVLSQDALWLEFGVAGGKSSNFIAVWLQEHFTNAVPPTLHGFDSFRGLPEAWAHSGVGEGAFSQGGEVPERLLGISNFEAHVGLFSATLQQVDASLPIAFAHIDVDIYSSAVAVLSRLACQLVPGSVLVFDEFVNYHGFERAGARMYSNKVLEAVG